MQIYIIGSLVVFAMFVVMMICIDIFERYKLFGFSTDSKFGSSLSGFMLPVTILLALSLLPFVNLIWIIIFGYGLVIHIREKRTPYDKVPKK